LESEQARNTINKLQKMVMIRKAFLNRAHISKVILT